MQIWLVEEGEKRGPFEPYELRDRIEKGRLSGEELAWHEGCPNWTPVCELALFRRSFEEEEPVPPPVPRRPRAFSRFWARWFDIYAYLLVVYGGMHFLGIDIFASFESALFRVLHLLPYLLLDAIAVNLWGTTPGKAMLGLRIEGPEEGKLPLGASLLRSVRVYILGLGLGLPVVSALCQGFCLWFTLRNGAAPWDVMTGIVVRSRSPGAVRIVAFVVLFLVVLLALSVFLKPVSDALIEDFLRELGPAPEGPAA